jgi:hypothetical protein
MSTLAEQLDAEFTTEVRQFEGRGGRTFDYIEDETVMDRLDEVLGKGEWSIEVEPISVADGIVKVTLNAFGRPYQDFGYSTNPSGDALKEAVSDGIRRCGRYLGIGRYLYRKHDANPVTSNGRAIPPPARPSAPPRPTIVSEDPYEDMVPPWEAQSGQQPVDPRDGGACPDHGIPWTLKPAGVSKAGKAYDAFWKCDGKTDGEFCRNKPTKAWQARHEG